MRRILFSLFVVFGSAAAVGIGATGAFFSDTEVSNGNTFAAGTLDLKIDNDSYYNGNRCTNTGTEEEPVWEWVGESSFPIPGTPCETSFPLADLDDGFVFFNFTDLKPDDEGEDTISIHVQNDAWACMDLTLTSNDDVSTTEPEGEVDEPEDGGDAWDGELASALEFFWWADDGDNVYEIGEAQISDGVQSLLDLAPQGDSFSVALADAESNVWDPTDLTPLPLPANETVYIAKAWCMGTLTMNALPDDADTGPQDRPGAVLCDGTALGNETQTDAVELNVVFTAVQARHNPDFICEPPEEEEDTVTLTVNKIITADTEGIGVEDFELHIDGPDGDQIVGDNIPTTGLPAGEYNVYEVIIEAGLPPGVTFTTTFGGACDSSGNVTLAPGENLVCTINNVENEQTTLFSDGFGTGSTDATFNEAPAWEKFGTSTEKRNSAGGGDEAASSGDGGRKAAMAGPDGYICRSVDATGFGGLLLSYAWRGDSDAEAGDEGIVEYATGGTCAAPTGLSTLATHPLTTTTWQDNAVALPGSLNNSVFFLRFRADSDAAGEDFRIDGVSLIGS